MQKFDSVCQNIASNQTGAGSTYSALTTTINDWFINEPNDPNTANEDFIDEMVVEKKMGRGSQPSRDIVSRHSVVARYNMDQKRFI